MPLTLNTIAGFADLKNGVLAAEQAALAVHLNRILSNAQFGMVRLETFQDRYVNGDTVNLPTSPIDQYPYQRDELLYHWTIGNTASPSNYWLSGPDCLWFLAHAVNQTTGAVTSEEWYRKSSVHNPDPAKSNDGILLVTTVAQRQLTNLVLEHEPFYQGDLSSLIGIDYPWSQEIARKLNDAAKFASLRNEFIYMGEFTNNQTVPRPISPADGHVYAYSECQFVSSWRWTTFGPTYKQPDNYLGQLQRLTKSVSSSGLVSTNVIYKGDGSSVYTTTHGRLSVFAWCKRPLTVGPLSP